MGKNCRKGICIVNVDEIDMTCTIRGVGIQCVKKREMAESLAVRQQIGIDPFHQGFEFPAKGHHSNLGAVRLCFQAFLNPKSENPTELKPVVTQIIRDKKSCCDLQIVEISQSWSPMKGIQYSLEKISLKNIVKFFSSNFFFNVFFDFCKILIFICNLSHFGVKVG